MQAPTRPKIAVLCSTDYNTYPVGGMMSFVKDAAPALSRRFAVDFWGVDAGSDVDSFNSGGETFPVRFFGSVRTGPKLIPNLVRVTWQLWRNRAALLSEGYDAIYIHGAPLNVALPASSTPKRINHIHGLTNPFLMQAHPGWTMRLIARRYHSYRRKVVQESDLVLLAADRLGIERFRAENPGKTRIEKIENFCDTTLFGSAAPVDRAAHGLPENARLIVHVGRFAYQKDPLLALEAFAAYRRAAGSPDDRLVMIGDGPLLDEGKAMAGTLGVAPQVLFLGNRTRDEIAGWLAGADLYLYTSHANGYPISLAEAAQSGLPIVSTAVTGVHDLVLPGENGRLVESRNPEAFVAPIAEALANREEWGSRSRALAAQYAPDIILDRLCREIADVL